MKSIGARNGKVEWIETKEPTASAGRALIRTAFSAISPGTELGILRSSVVTPMPLGYSAAGIVAGVGESVANLLPGQQAACYGAPYVQHAPLLSVPSNLIAPLPDTVGLEEASFAGLGAIAIHALRTADIRFGEYVIVVGLGILGNLIAQIAAAACTTTIGIDTNVRRAAALRRLLPNVPVFSDSARLEAHLPELTDKYGADCVIVCAGGADSSLIDQALRWLRDRGKVVIVGDVPGSFSRELQFRKEAQILISRAGGAGRYDPSYELRNVDYPIGYVRWTEGRNMRAFVRMLERRQVTLTPLISAIVPFRQAADAYELCRADAGPDPVLGVILQYD